MSSSPAAPTTPSSASPCATAKRVRSPSMSAATSRHCGAGSRWRPGCQPQPIEIASPPREAEVAVQQLALAPLAALVLLGERRRVAEPVEQVLGRVGLAHGGAKATSARSAAAMRSHRLTARVSPLDSRERLRHGEAGAARPAAGVASRRARASAATSSSSRWPASTPESRILDIGCGRLGLRRHEPDLDITGVDLVARPDYPGPFVDADVLEGLPFADGEFDLAYCSSVIEHVAPPRPRARSRASCGASRAAGTCRRPRSRSPSSRTRCCRSRTGCRRALRRPVLAPRRRRRVGGDRAAAPRRDDRAVRRRPSPSGSARSSRAGSASGPYARGSPPYH